MDKNDIINYVMHTPHNTNRAVLSSMLNQLTEGGGGGSSDFSTAKVTIVNNANSHVKFFIPVVYADETLESANAAFSVDPNSTAVTDVILYKGSALCPEVQSVEVPEALMSVSGNITEGAFGLLIITGDGTITIDGVDAGGID